MKFKVFKPKLPKPEQGFTIFEVLIAILIATIFVAVTMQMMVVAALFKVRAQEYAEATAWIQEDLEDVKYQASSFPYTSLTANAAAGDTGITVTSADSFAVNDKLKVGSDTGTYTISAKSANTLTITPGLGTAQSSNALVVATTATTRCKNSMLTSRAASGATSIQVASGGNFASGDSLKVGSDAGTYTIASISGTTLTLSTGLGTEQLSGAAVVVANSNAGFADGFRDFITDTNHSNGITNITTNDTTPISNLKPSKLTGKQFQISRTATLSNTIPYNVLQISYSVAPQNAHTTLSSAASTTSTTLTVAFASEFKAGDQLTVGTDTDNEIQSISGTTITIRNQLGSAQPAGAVVDASIATLNTEVIPNAALQCPN
jgi:type II secretory pathway pseudopilin PulG